MKQFIKNYFFQNRIEYIKVFIVFIIGIVISIMIVNQSNNEQKLEMKEYIDNKIELVKLNNYENKMEVFKNSIFRNLKNYILIVLLSSSIIGLPVVYFIVIKKAFSIGYTAASIFATQNTKTAIIFICNSILFHNIIYLASIFIVLVSGVLFTKAFFEKRNLKFEVFRYMFFALIGLILIIVSSLCEAYISMNFLYLLKKYL